MNRIKELRAARKLNQSQLAQIIGIAQPTLSGWETGRTQIDYDNLIKLANFFETSIDYLLGQTPDLASRVPVQCIDLNTSHIDKALGKIKAEKAAQLAGKLLALGDAEKVDVTLELLEHLSEMEHKQLEALRDFLRTMK